MTNLCQKVALAGAATVAVAATIMIAESASAQSVTICQSVNYQTTRCSINTRRGVFIEKELSRAACIPGVTWDYRGGVVWVRDGCRAQFRSGGNWDDRPELYYPPEETYHPPKPRSRRRIRRPRRIPCP